MDNNMHRNSADYTDYYNDYHDYHDIYRDRYIQGRTHKNSNRPLYMTTIIILLSVISVLIYFIFSKIFVQSSAFDNTNPDVNVSASATQPTTSKRQNNSPVNHNYFNNTVFVGDSISVSFQMYVDNERDNGNECLGDAYILANESLSYTNSIELPAGDPNSVLPIYKGVQQNLEDSIADIAPEKVYIMLGMNDIAGRDPQDVLEYAKTLINRIKEKLPKVKILLESVTPKIASAETNELNNDTIRTFNEALKQFATDNEYKYLDIYSAVCDENGYLKEEYCGDPEGMGMHFTFEGDKVIMEYLLNHPEGEDFDVSFKSSSNG